MIYRNCRWIRPGVTINQSYVIFFKMSNIGVRFSIFLHVYLTNVQVFFAELGFGRCGRSWEVWEIWEGWEIWEMWEGWEGE
jgi:hypothetical protein